MGGYYNRAGNVTGGLSGGSAGSATGVVPGDSANLGDATDSLANFAITNPTSGIVDNPQIYEALGGDKVAGLVDNAGNLVAVYNAIEALEGGVDGVGEALTVASGFASGAKIAGFTQFAGIAGPLALGSLAIMLATSDQDFPRSFASIEYDPEHSYQSGYYGYKDELNPSGS